MQFVKATSDDSVVSYLSKTLGDHLRAGERVLWLLSGGSAIKIAVEVSKRISAIPAEGLAVSLVDERFGPVGHADSNWQQLYAAGFAIPGANLLPVLTGEEQAKTAITWGNKLDELLNNSDYRIGLFGIGPDGHTSGILPHSAAVTASGVAFAYDGGTYRRVTTTVPAILRLDEAVVYAVGEAKWPTLDHLKNDVPLDDQPAQVLKKLDKLMVFTDHTGE